MQNCTGLWLGVLWGKDAKAGRQLTASQLLLECCSQAVFLGSFHSLSKEFTQSVLAKEIEPHAVLKQYNNSNKTNKKSLLSEEGAVPESCVGQAGSCGMSLRTLTCKGPGGRIHIVLLL